MKKPAGHFRNVLPVSLMDRSIEFEHRQIKTLLKISSVFIGR